MDYVYLNIVSTQLEHRVAAMLVFESILHASTREEVESHLIKGYESFYSLFSDQNLIIQKYNLIVFQSLIKYHSYVLLENGRLMNIINIYMLKATGFSSDDDDYTKQIKFLYLNSLFKIFKAYKEIEKDVRL